ncbi:MAG: [Fe-S]-binding protein, partial [Deltaproteobacteria bacterium]|nr:[Fe-S]-binding protein [Deltaproteobacteria bacterium]
MKKTPEDNAWIKKLTPEIIPPSLQDNTADVDRLIKGIKKGLQTGHVGVDFSLVKRLPHILNQYGYLVEALLFKANNGWRLIDIFPIQTGNRIYVLAVDLGSSTVVVRLFDLASQEIKDEISFHNPQIKIGSDILTRIHYTAREGGLEELQGLVIKRLNKEIDQLAGKHGIDPSSIAGMSVAGNTTMTH